MSIGPLDHDSSAYEEIWARVNEISMFWKTTRAEMLEQRPELEELWERARAEPAWPIVRVLIAHLLADLQSEAQDELRWDLESLRCLEPVWVQTADPRLFDVGRRCLPSLYLSLADASRKCGDLPGAKEFARRSRLFIDLLQPDPYRDAIVRELDRVERYVARRLKPSESSG